MQRPAKLLALLVMVCHTVAALACDMPVSVCAGEPGRGLALVRAGQPAAVYVDAGADAARQHASRN
ncbi:MAG TPA: hypothetical protein VNJ04_17195, partial [Gemmatimonadaceae bacterium]|nr:hypothetical protein [Gemmatimonadaceae bacterium]